MSQADKRERALRAIANTLYADTMMAEPFNDLSPEEKAHYFDLAEQCFAKIESIYDLKNDADDETAESGQKPIKDGIILALPDKPVPFRDLAVGQTAVLIDRIDDGEGTVEIRVNLYRRAEGVFSSPTEPEGRFIPSYCLGMIQGEPDGSPRYITIRETPILNATSAGAAVFPVDITSLKQVMIPADRKAAPQGKGKQKNKSAGKKGPR